MTKNQNSFTDYFTTDEVQSLKAKPFWWLRSESKVFTFLEILWKNNFRQYGFEYLAEQIFEIIQNCKTNDTADIVQQIESVFTDPNFKKFTRFARQANIQKMDLNYQIIKDYLVDANSFFDFGCGRMALIRRIVRENQQLERLYGYDPKSNPYYRDFDPRVTFLEKIDSVKSINPVDIVYSSFVLHHLTEEEIDEALATIISLLKPNGKFILLEETYPQISLNAYAQDTHKFLLKFGYENSIELFDIFDSLSDREKMLVIYLNDVLINSKNLSYMPWTFTYRTAEGWKERVEKYGLKMPESEKFWILHEGKIKQGITGFMVFEKI